ncbi:MAG: phospholipase C, phosphocholine-specific [Williamsia sp.]|nr:phospholipase C, phosphocholine-specific [Williamsia sp.]
MYTRRDFLKQAALLSSGTALMNMLPPVIQKALAVNPAPGSTFYDAEHIVFLMQENRSFDHVFGSLQGVRGYNDPRAIRLNNGNKVWLQSDLNGDTYAPFHLNINNTKAPWMGSLPHGWSDQTDARNKGKYDRWLHVKKASNKLYREMPLTLGYCNRSDFPFYYSLADAFTVCDHNFCSSITGTHPNRHYWMSGTVRESNTPEAKAHLWNVTNYATPELGWKTFPERLEENGVSWKVYQNELTMGYGLKGEESAWLSNFGTNVLEYFRQYNVRLHPGAIANLQVKEENIRNEIAALEKLPASDDTKLKLAAAQKVLAGILADQEKYSKENYDRLIALQKELNQKAFSTNIDDPFYHDLTTLQFNDKGTERQLRVPKGDILQQFREDVQNGSLPTVSWLMPSANFSDHPSLPWFGPWYVSEIMEILLQNPEVWKKTVFVLTYDENDGYYDHMPPFVVPNPYEEHTGKVSKGIDPRMDFVTKDQQTNPSATANRLRESAVGLGYRVPMIIASPWTRGGFVCSEVFDHTSSLQFLEIFLEKKFNKKIREENITQWRRTICGDLTSAFRPYNGEKMDQPDFLNKDPFLESIYQAQFRQVPDNYKKLSAAEIDQINTDHSQSPYFPKQETGVRQACALPYELYTDGEYNKSKNIYALNFKAGDHIFGSGSAGSPFCVYSINAYRGEKLRTWNYSVAAGDALQDEWNIADFEDGQYHLRIYGPNGFYREFIGNNLSPVLSIACSYEQDKMSKGKLTGNIIISVANKDVTAHTIEIKSNVYKTGDFARTIAPQSQASFTLNLSGSYNWYDVRVKVKGNTLFEERFAGHVETGLITKTDPLMGGVV